LKWKPLTRELSKWYEQCLDMLEHESCHRYSPKELEKVKLGLTKKLRELVPERFQYVGIPTFFQFTDAVRIKQIILEKKKNELAVFFSHIAENSLKAKKIRYLQLRVKFTDI